ncbi:sensor histidine kinase [uncultured Chitinophaga sp.]|mgnify:CR=1 FL=1|uniref:sensor histidine kinase n=1 Tax=uncultured Chitinophaga sp. TaxID=339340 RepID=UPI002620AD97|nr:sensor histidine kinase [uncultured Chitinophaga sp.]
MLRLYSILTFLLVSCSGLSAQELSFRHLTTAGGLLSDLGLVLTEDRQGRLWIGSEEGINVFDGYQLSSYRVPANSGLISNNIINIHCDTAGTIWIYTPAGIQYKRENDSRFLQFSSRIAGNSKVLFFGNSPDGQLLLLSSSHLYQLDADMQLKTLTGLSPLLQQYGAPLTFEHFRDNEWLIGFRDKLVLIDSRQQYPIKEFAYGKCWTIGKVNDSIILAGSFSKDTLALINMRSGAITCINNWPADDGKPIGGYAGTIRAIGNNRFAVACRYDGLYIIDLNQRKAYHHTHDPGDHASVSSTYCRSLLVTRNGTLFVHSRGVSYSTLSSPQFRLQKHLVNSTGQKYDGSFNTFWQDSNRHLWIGTNSHLARLDRRTGVSAYYTYYDPAGGPRKYKTIRSIVADKANRIWAGTFGGGMGMLQANGTFKQYRRNAQDPAHSLPANDIHAIVTDKHGNFIICTLGGFAYFNPLTQQMQTFFTHHSLREIAHRPTYYAMADSADNWWLGQADGLYCYNRQKDSLLPVKLPLRDADHTIRAIATDSTGMIYAGSFSGLFIISPHTLTVQKVIDRQDGLPSDNIMGLLCDQGGRMWILGITGLSRYDPQSGSVESFDARDGLEQSNHGLCNFYMAPDGEIFTGSAAGFNHFYPGQISSKVTPLPVFITSLVLRDTTISTIRNNSYRLKYYQNNLSLSYLAVDFQLGPSVQYRYKLSAFDTGYVYAGQQRIARYTNLKPGNYTFIAEASVNGKDWHAAQHPIRITIPKAFWATAWFRLLAASLLLLLVYLLYRYRIWQVNKEARLRSDYEIKLNELENSALRTQMNPHFIFNSLNTINSFVNSNNRAQSNLYISKFSKLIRLILDHSRQKKITLRDELEVAMLYIQLEQIRFEQRFQFDIQVSGADPDITEVPPLIIQPFVENAILHGLLPKKQDGRLKVEIIKHDASLRCIIEDNGIGRAAARHIRESTGYKRRSHGMEITIKRISLFNKENGLSAAIRITDLENENGQASGTRVEIPLAYTECF